MMRTLILTGKIGPAFLPCRVSFPGRPARIHWTVLVDVPFWAMVKTTKDCSVIDAAASFSARTIPSSTIEGH